MTESETDDLVDRAYLFTDLEGSTQAWERSPALMHRVLAEHDRLLNEAIESHGGHVFSVAGDAFSAAFATVDSAVGCAVRAQRSLTRGRWPEGLEPRVRMGIHRGEAYVRGDNYFGSTLNRAARLMSVAHGGQVVVSGEVASTVEPLGFTLRDLGRHRLKDVSEPLAVWQVVADGLPDGFPPLRTQDAGRIDVPRPGTPFFGREHELGTIARLLDEAAVVTIVGAGGRGKTRLAYEAAHAVGGRFPGGATAVELGDGGADDVLARTLEAVLARDPLARVEGAADPTTALSDHLADRRTLLLLDNCEHVLEPVRALVDHLVARCPELVVLATSQEALAVDGERVVRLDPLDGATAVELFVERAAAVGTRLDDADRPLVAALCDQVEGLPLAVELAAARTGTLSVAQITDRLQHDIGVLRRRQAKSEDRHRSLEAAIAWSYDLLDEDERALLDALAVFVGGADLGAVIEVGSALGIADAEDRLEALVDRSLVSVERAGRSPRFRLPEAIRQFTLPRLAARDADGRAERAHAEHYLSVARSVVPALDLDTPPVAVERLQADHDNFLVAIERGLAERPGESALLAMTLHTYWEETGNLAVGAETLTRVLHAAPTDPRALTALGALVPYEAMCGRLHDARGRSEVLAGLLDQGLPPMVEARICFALGFVAQAGGELTRAVDLWSAAFAHAADHDPDFARQVGFSVAYAALTDDDTDRAGALLDRARSLPSPAQVWFPPMTAVVEHAAAMAVGDDRSAAIVGELATLDAMGLRFRCVLATALGAVALHAVGHEDEADRWCRHGLALSRDMGHLWACSILLEPAAWGVATRDPALAGRAWGAVDRFRAERGYGPWPLISRVGAGRRALWAESMGPEHEAVLARGAASGVAEVVDEVLGT